GVRADGPLAERPRQLGPHRQRADRVRADRLAGGPVEQPDLVDARVVEVRDGEREDVRGRDDVPVLPPLVAPAGVGAAGDPVGVVERATRPADRSRVQPAVGAAQGDRFGDLSLGHAGPSTAAAGAAASLPTGSEGDGPGPPAGATDAGGRDVTSSGGPAHPQGVAPVAVPVADENLVAGAAVDTDEVRLAGGDAVVHEVLGAAADREGVAPVRVPVAGEDDVGRPAVDDDLLRPAGGDAVVHEVLGTAADREGVAPVTVPVPDDDLVVRAAVGHHLVGLAARDAGLHGVLPAAAHREGGGPVPVPVPDEDDVARAAVGDHRAGLAAAQPVGDVEHVPPAHGDGVDAVP